MPKLDHPFDDHMEFGDDKCQWVVDVDQDTEGQTMIRCGKSAQLHPGYQPEGLSSYAQHFVNNIPYELRLHIGTLEGFPEYVMLWLTFREGGYMFSVHAKTFEDAITKLNDGWQSAIVGAIYADRVMKIWNGVRG